jgi:hypothetical protein
MPRSWVLQCFHHLRTGEQVQVSVEVCVEEKPTGLSFPGNLTVREKGAHFYTGWCGMQACNTRGGSTAGAKDTVWTQNQTYLLHAC